jgi:hypothetical protein
MGVNEMNEIEKNTQIVSPVATQLQDEYGKKGFELSYCCCL